MKIKYIKDAPNGPAGSNDDVTDFEGNILILTGYAELAEVDKPKPKAKTKPKTKTDSE
ncbi:hypothetical protein [Psychrobacter sp. DAB_AL32B]|uniref:hypothetical protein n=1 Tax=Psychrobacter sp. DAB_AL32B TaxID=1028414 RepID=UPI0013FDD514|nr:hypothetical protein [Psychrobacter sp. DAB_AL32B]